MLNLLRSARQFQTCRCSYTSDYYINVPLEATYMETWNGLPQPLRDLVL
ncbi:MAG: hypothetical protein R3C56_08155 [Pirellulaceae bacterium]